MTGEGLWKCPSNALIERVLRMWGERGLEIDFFEYVLNEYRLTYLCCQSLILSTCATIIRVHSIQTHNKT
jgi:hypothetical protein